MAWSAPMSHVALSGQCWSVSTVPAIWWPKRQIYFFILKLLLPVGYTCCTSNQHIYFQCSLLQDSPDSFHHLLLIHFSFSLFSNVGTTAFSVAGLNLFNLLPINVQSAGIIYTFRRQLKNTCLNTLILHSSSANQSKCLRVKLFIDK